MLVNMVECSWNSNQSVRPHRTFLLKAPFQRNRENRRVGWNVLQKWKTIRNSENFQNPKIKLRGKEEEEETFHVKIENPKNSQQELSFCRVPEGEDEADRLFKWTRLKEKWRRRNTLERVWSIFQDFLANFWHSQKFYYFSKIAKNKRGS